MVDITILFSLSSINIERGTGIEFKLEDNILSIIKVPNGFTKEFLLVNYKESQIEQFKNPDIIEDEYRDAIMYVMDYFDFPQTIYSSVLNLDRFIVTEIKDDLFNYLYLVIRLLIKNNSRILTTSAELKRISFWSDIIHYRGIDHLISYGKK